MKDNNEQLIKKVLETFGIDVQSIISPTDSYGSTVRIITNKNSERIVLKIPYDEGRYFRERDALKLLDSENIKAPSLINFIDPNQEYKTGVLLMSFLEGNSIVRDELKVAQSEQAGSLLANFHTIGKGEFNDEVYEEIKNWWTKSISALSEWKERVSTKIEDEDLINKTIDLIKQSKLVGEDISYGLLHSDFRPGNILTKGDSITGVIDFENTKYGDTLWDFVKVSNEFWQSEDLKQSFLDGYKKYRQVPNLKSIDKYLLVNAFGSLDWSIRRNDDDYFNANLNRLKKLVI